MSLFLHELTHLVISLCIGFLVWKKYKKAFPAFFAAILGGFFIDADHLFDYYLVFGLDFNLKNFLESQQFLLSNKLYVPFHAWEWVALLSFLYLKLDKQPKKRDFKISKYLLSFLLALTLGIYSHLIIDIITNKVVISGYSIIYRAVNNFNSDTLTNEKLPIH